MKEEELEKKLKNEVFVNYQLITNLEQIKNILTTILQLNQRILKKLKGDKEGIIRWAMFYFGLLEY